MKIDFKAKIDTEELRTSADNINDVNDIDEERFNYTKFKRINKQNEVVFVLHLSRYKGRYDVSNYSYSEQMKAKGEMLKQLGINVLNDVKLNRIDICFDSEVEYMTMYKLNDCLMGLYRLEYKEVDSIDIRSQKLRRSTSMSCSPRHQQLYIYDKKHESKGMHPYNTRIEFRFKDIKVDEATKIKDLINLLDRLITNFEMFEKQRAEDLYEWFKQDLENGVVRNFSEFVRHNDQYITTTGICEALHGMIGLKGSYKKWLNKYRQTNNIEFTTKTEVKQMIADMKKSIKVFRKA